MKIDNSFIGIHKYLGTNKVSELIPKLFVSYLFQLYYFITNNLISHFL